MGERWELPALFSWHAEDGQWIVRRHLGPGLSWPKWPDGIDALIDLRNAEDPLPRTRVAWTGPAVLTMGPEALGDRSHACAEQNERGRITNAGQFHYEGNSTPVPAFCVSWCTARTPRASDRGEPT